MQEYLYIFNYPPMQKELCHLEVQYLFDQTLVSKELFTTKKISHHTSIFIKARIDILVKEKNFDVLIETLKTQSNIYSSFKTIYIKNEANHVEYNESLQKCNAITRCIEGKIDFKTPETMLALTKVDGYYVVGVYHHGTPSWNLHQTKPYTFSNALDIRLARTIINLASSLVESPKIIDPCCGMGTVVLEGLAMNQIICGTDISRDISYKARLNVEYFGYDGTCIKQSSIQDIQDHYDVSIIDIPYNLYAPITHEQQVDILRQARRISDYLILVSYDRMDDELQEVGFTIKEYCPVKKSMTVNFERKIYICR